MMTAAEDSFGMLIFISAFPSCGLDAWLRVISSLQTKVLRAKALRLFISFLRVPEKVLQTQNLMGEFQMCKMNINNIYDIEGT